MNAKNAYCERRYRARLFRKEREPICYASRSKWRGFGETSVPLRAAEVVPVMRGRWYVQFYSCGKFNGRSKGMPKALAVNVARAYVNS